MQKVELLCKMAVWQITGYENNLTETSLKVLDCKKNQLTSFKLKLVSKTSNGNWFSVVFAVYPNSHFQNWQPPDT